MIIVITSARVVGTVRDAEAVVRGGILVTLVDNTVQIVTRKV